MAIVPTAIKRCYVCKRDLPVTEFYRCASRRDGLTAECKECRLEYQRTHPEVARVATRRYRDSHPEYATHASQWRKGHREVLRAGYRQYNQEHPEAGRAFQRRRNAWKRGNGHIPYREADIYKRDKGVCWLCGLPVSVEECVYDHFYPVSKGGPDRAENVRVAHAQCNGKKHDRLPTHEEAQAWLKALGHQEGG